MFHCMQLKIIKKKTNTCTGSIRPGRVLAVKIGKQWSRVELKVIWDSLKKNYTTFCGAITRCKNAQGRGLIVRLGSTCEMPHAGLSGRMHDKCKGQDSAHGRSFTLVPRNQIQSPSVRCNFVRLLSVGWPIVVQPLSEVLLKSIDYWYRAALFWFL